MSELKGFLEQVVERGDLSFEAMQRAFQIIMSGGANPCEVAAFLSALRTKGETVEEITAAASIMRMKAEKITAPKGAIDTCGTGGDASGTYNISTAVAILTAACGVFVAKHGNKAVSSQSGSADVFSHLGVDISIAPKQVEACLHTVGLCFMMAPKFHSAMRHVVSIRQELGIRTLFNLLGPLSNPAGIKRQLLGVYDQKWTGVFANVLKKLGSTHAWVVNGSDGLDEITITGNTFVSELKEGEIRHFELSPEQAGLPTYHPDDIRGKDKLYNAQQMLRVFDGQEGAHRDIILLNTAAALLIADKVSSIKQGVEFAASVLDERKALAKLDQLVSFTNG